MQGNDFVQSVMYRRGVTCFSCHDVHGTMHNADTIKTARDLCTTCHNPGSTNGPHNAEPVHELPQGQEHSVGARRDARLAERVALESRIALCLPAARCRGAATVGPTGSAFSAELHGV
jgi:predicted CXXCH cytochrome family protein